MRRALAIMFGLVTLILPGAAMLSLVLVFAAYALVDGVFAIGPAMQSARSHERWGLLVLEGIVDIVAGVIAVLWPGLTIPIFVLLVAARALVSGVRERLDARLREAHVELIYASRLSTASQMAAALAHELNQPLAAIANSLGAARRALVTGTSDSLDVARVVMDEAMGQSLRAGQVVNRLRNFLIRAETEIRVENVSAMVEEASALALIGPNALGVEVRVLLDPAAPHILADWIEIQLVLINLMRNALEAMAGMDRRLLRLTTELKRSGAVEFAVADSGPGVDIEIADRIFEPFVTTKRNGMGIGLSVCHSIIETHGGRLRFEANPGGGTIFSFTLPAAPSAGARDAE